MLPDHEFVKPSSLAEAVSLLAPETRSIKLNAADTDVVFNMHGCLFEPELLLSLRELPGLISVSIEDDALVIGGGCRLTDLEHDAEITQLPVLVAALRGVAPLHDGCLGSRNWPYQSQRGSARYADLPAKQP
jgi:CO/xanthine dehydrogenase FAD-binding subunit